MKEKYLILLLLSSTMIVNAQTYYGKNQKGKLDLINDSLYTISILSDIGMEGLVESPDTGYYRKRNDTIWLSSKIKTPFEIKVSKKEESVYSGYTVLLKQYRQNNKSYELSYENCNGIFDTVNRQIVYNFQPISKNNLLVIYDGAYYYRLKWKEIEGSFFTIKFMFPYPDLFRIVYFDEFPLLIKKDKLVPIDKEKNEQCWVDNGFYFPVMKGSKKKKEFKTVARWSIGLQGLPCSICIPSW